MVVLAILGGCGWWEAYQACEAAKEAEGSAWTALHAQVGPAAEIARVQAEATAAAAGAVDMTMGAASAGPGAPPAVSRGEAAQDAFTRASRTGGTADGAAEARWVDWSARAYEQAAEAERRAELTVRMEETLRLRARASAAAEVALALAYVRYESAVRTGPARTSLGFTASLPPTAPPEEKAEAVRVERAALDAAVEARAAQTSAMTAAFATAGVAAYEAERAGQEARSTGDAYNFMGFPDSAQTARAASLAAQSSATRASERAAALRAVVEEVKAGVAQPPSVDAAARAAVAAATEASLATQRSCE
jgi:hypothetical protein